jgi:prevent-host-death family protein
VAVVNIHEAKTHLSRLVEQALQGEEIIIAKSGKPLVKLAPIEADSAPRPWGTMKGLIHMAPDFDDPLPDDLLALFEGSDE